MIVVVDNLFSSAEEFSLVHFYLFLFILFSIYFSFISISIFVLFS